MDKGIHLGRELQVSHRQLEFSSESGAGGMGSPQLGLPRLRVVPGRPTGIAMGPDHTPLG
jgi:hypothetical protein